MAWRLMKCRDDINDVNYKEFDCETKDDINDLPGLEVCSMGSLAFVWEGALIYKLSSTGRWKEVG